MIYVARNPKDALVSFFYFHKLVKLCNYTGEMEQFADYFMNNKRKLNFSAPVSNKIMRNVTLSSLDALFRHCFGRLVEEGPPELAVLMV